MHRCNLALRKTIKALMQPIGVRDLAFDPINGLLSDDAVGSRKLAQPFADAGYPCKVDKE